MKNQYMTQKKEKSFENTLHKNSKTYLDVQNEFAPKLKISWVVSDPMQTWPAHCSGQAVTDGETPFRPEVLVLKFFYGGVRYFLGTRILSIETKKCLGSETTHDNLIGLIFRSDGR